MKRIACLFAAAVFSQTGQTQTALDQQVALWNDMVLQQRQIALSTAAMSTAAMQVMAAKQALDAATAAFEADKIKQQALCAAQGRTADPFAISCK